MENRQIENSIKKMGLLLEKVVQKLDDLEKRVSKLEEKNNITKEPSKTFLNNFLGSMGGTLAGMGLYNLLFNHSVSVSDFAKDLEMNSDEIKKILEDDMNEIDAKLDELDKKIEHLESKEFDNYFEDYEQNEMESDFEKGFDDLEGLDEI